MSMSSEERVELAVRRTRSQLLQEFPQNVDVLRMLEVLGEELAYLSQNHEITTDCYAVDEAAKE